MINFVYYNYVILFFVNFNLIREGYEQGSFTEDIVRDFLFEIRKHTDWSFVPYAEDELVSFNFYVIEMNCIILISIVEAVYFCKRQFIELRSNLHMRKG